MTFAKQNRILFMAAVSIVLTLAAPVAHARDDQSRKAKAAAAQSAKAARVFAEIMDAPDKAVPQDLLKRAKAIAVFPKVLTALVVGAEGGRGAVSRRTKAGWSDPVFFRAAGPSVGPQIGASSTDIVLLLMNDDAVAHLMKDRFGLGADLAVAAGSVGRDASAGTDALMHAEILSYSRSRGAISVYSTADSAQQQRPK